MCGNLESTAMFKNAIYDSRMLTSSCFFYRLSREDVEALTMDVANWICDLLDGNFVVDWTLDSRRLRSNTNFIRKLEQKLQRKEDSWYFSSDGFVRSELITNQAQMMWQRKESLNCCNIVGSESADFSKYLQELFSNGCVSDLEFLERIHKLHNEPNRFYINNCRYRDLYCSYGAKQHPLHKNLFNVDFRFHIYRFSLANSINSFSNMLLGYMKKLSEKYINMNGHIMLQPYGACHMSYFGRDSAVNEPIMAYGYTEDEVYNAYYLSSVEWANIVSPLTRTRILSVTPKSETESIHIEEIQGGALLVSSKKAISEIDVKDLRPMKILLYDALYPGTNRRHIQQLSHSAKKGLFGNFPRCRWENVPILEGEINVDNGYLLYRHLSRK